VFTVPDIDVYSLVFGSTLLSSSHTTTPHLTVNSYTKTSPNKSNISASIMSMNHLQDQDRLEKHAEDNVLDGDAPGSEENADYKVGKLAPIDSSW